MQLKPIFTPPIDVKYIYTQSDIQAIIWMCGRYAEAEIEEGLQTGVSKVDILLKIDCHVQRIIQESLQKKLNCNEIATQTGSLLDQKAQALQIDPINEVMHLHYEHLYYRYILNELIISNEEFKKIINEDCFSKARSFALEEVSKKFPLVKLDLKPTSDSNEENKAKEKIE